MSETLKDKTAKGLFWGSMNNVVQQGLGLLFGIVLGRLLSRADYGMIAMITIFSLVATALQESGFRSALANLRNPSHRDFNAVFWFNIIVGVACYALLFFAAPLIARFYKTPELTLLCRVAFLSIVFAALGTAQSGFLFCNLKVKEQAQCNMAATVVSNITGLVMALCGCGYWSLAVQTLVYIGMNSALMWWVSDWHPTFEFDFRPVRSMFRFSSKMLATNILERINANVMNILLGRFFTKSEVGDYNQAYQWSSKMSYLMQGTLSQVAQPVFSHVADERERQLRVLRKMVRFTAFLAFPMLFGFGIVAQEFIVLTIGPKWIHSARLLQLLCISGAFIPVSYVLTNLLISKGKSNIYFGCTLALCLLLLGTMLVTYPYGIRAMVIAYVCIYTLWTFVWHFFTWRLMDYTLLQFLYDILGFAGIAFLVMAATWLATRQIGSLLLLLAARIGMAAVLYYVVMRLLRVKILDECITFLTAKLKRR